MLLPCALNATGITTIQNAGRRSERPSGRREKALNIALNKIQGDWDEEKLRYRKWRSDYICK